MAPNRVRGLAAVCASGVAAGTIDSRKGKAMVTPAPRRNVRRERCFFVMNIMIFSSSETARSSLYPERVTRNYSLLAPHREQFAALRACHSTEPRGRAHRSTIFQSQSSQTPHACREELDGGPRDHSEVFRPRVRRKR